MPDLADLTKDETDITDTGLKSPVSNSGDHIGTIPEHEVPEGEDVADRAANMLQGLRGDADGDDSIPRDSSLRVRRRRESADDERRNRRRRRTVASGSGGSGDHEHISSTSGSGTITEEPAVETSDLIDETNKGSGNPGKGPDVSTPTTVVSPPSPDGTEDKPVEILD